MKLRIAFISILLICVGTAFGLYKKAEMLPPVQKVAALAAKNVEAAAAKALLPPPADPVRVQRAIQIGLNIENLNSQIQTADHELQQRGFPKLFLDQRLTDRERQEILDKLAIVNQLQLRLTRLKIQKVNLETEESL